MSDPSHEFGEEPVVFDSDDDAELDAATLRGLADIEAGRFVTHEAVMRWLKSWGTADELPPPKCGE